LKGNTQRFKGVISCEENAIALLKFYFVISKEEARAPLVWPLNTVANNPRLLQQEKHVSEELYEESYAIRGEAPCMASVIMLMMADLSYCLLEVVEADSEMRLR
jgi:hypothetical protein